MKRREFISLLSSSYMEVTNAHIHVLPKLD